MVGGSFFWGDNFWFEFLNKSELSFLFFYDYGDLEGVRDVVFS